MTDRKSNEDIINYLQSIAYGDVALYIKRVNHQNAEIITTAEETLKYADNNEAMQDFVAMVNKLLGNGYNGELNVKLVIKNGNIDMMGIFNKKVTKYKIK